MFGPADMSWPHQASTALVGDAAHFGPLLFDAGANLALQDGVEFVLDLIAAHDPAPALAAYERKLFERAGTVGKQAVAELEALLSTDGGQRFTQVIAKRLQSHDSAHNAGGDVRKPALSLEKRVQRLEDLEAIRTLAISQNVAP